jgi:hypothetical protein
MFDGLTRTALAEILAAVEPVELKGVALLRQCHPQPFFPAGIDPAELAEATVEIIEYTRACEACLHRLKGLRPIPLTEIPVEEFPL